MQKAKQKRLKDIDLIKRYLETRNAAYFDMLYNRYSSKIYAKCISMLRNEAKAQDATQEIFTKIFLNLSKFEEQSKFSTWVYSITYNFCIDLIRKNKKSRNLFSDDELENTGEVLEEVPDHELLTMEVKRLKRVLEEMLEGDRAILLMKYNEEMSIFEIAEALNKSESAIKMRILRAKQKARSIYKQLYSEN